MTETSPIRFCPQCGTKGDQAWRFCVSCGATMPVHEPPPPIGQPPPPEAELVAEPQPEPLAEPEPEIVAEPQPELLAEPQPEPQQEPLAEPQPEPQPEPLAEPQPAALAEPQPETVTRQSAQPLPAPRGPSGEHVNFVPIDRSTSLQLSNGLDRATTVAQFALLVVALCGLITVLLLYLLNSRLEDASETGNLDSAESIDRLLSWGAQPLMVITLIGAIATLMRWTTVAYSAAWATGRPEVRVSRQIANVSWIAPIVNLIVPPIVMHDLWRRAKHDDSELPNPWITLWPALIGLGATVALISWASGSEGLSDSINTNTWSGVGYTLITMGVLSLTVALSSVSDAQRDALHNLHGGPPSHLPPPDLLTRLGRA